MPVAMHSTHYRAFGRLGLQGFTHVFLRATVRLVRRLAAVKNMATLFL